MTYFLKTLLSIQSGFTEEQATLAEVHTMVIKAAEKIEQLRPDGLDALTNSREFI